MKKLELDLDDLRVETFETDEKEVPRGTVVGQEFSSSVQYGCGGACYSDTCDYTYDDPTCEYSDDCNSNDWACLSEGGGSC